MGDHGAGRFGHTADWANAAGFGVHGRRRTIEPQGETDDFVVLAQLHFSRNLCLARLADTGDEQRQL